MMADPKFLKRAFFALRDLFKEEEQQFQKKLEKFWERSQTSRLRPLAAPRFARIAVIAPKQRPYKSQWRYFSLNKSWSENLPEYFSQFDANLSKTSDPLHISQNCEDPARFEISARVD